MARTDPVIVVVDDEPAVLDLLCEVLTEEGYTVVPVPDPNRTLELAAATPPDLFIIDIMLPDLTGLDLAARVREAGYDHVPLVGISASRRWVTQAEESGLFRLAIQKPFDLDHLLGSIAQLVGPGPRRWIG